MTKAEGILRNIFAFDKKTQTLGKAITTAALVSGSISLLKNMAGNKSAEDEKKMKKMPKLRENQEKINKAHESGEDRPEPVAVPSGEPAESVGTGISAELAAASAPAEKKETKRPKTRRTVNYGKRALKGYGKFVASTGMKLAGMSLAANAGAPKALAAGVALDEARKRVVREAKAVKPRRQAGMNDRDFEEKYNDNFKNYLKQNYTDEEIMKLSKNLMETLDTSKISDEKLQGYAQLLKDKQLTNAAMGDKNASASTLEEVKKLLKG